MASNASSIFYNSNSMRIFCIFWFPLLSERGTNNRLENVLVSMVASHTRVVLFAFNSSNLTTGHNRYSK